MNDNGPSPNPFACFVYPTHLRYPKGSFTLFGLASKHVQHVSAAAAAAASDRQSSSLSSRLQNQKPTRMRMEGGGTGIADQSSDQNQVFICIYSYWVQCFSRWPTLTVAFRIRCSRSHPQELFRQNLRRCCCLFLYRRELMLARSSEASEIGHAEVTWRWRRDMEIDKTTSPIDETAIRWKS